MSMGAQLSVGTLLLGVVGWLVDSWLGTEPWCLLAFGLIGAVAGLWHIIAVVMKISNVHTTKSKDK